MPHRYMKDVMMTFSFTQISPEQLGFLGSSVGSSPPAAAAAAGRSCNV